MIQHWNTVIEYLAEKEQTTGNYDLAILAGNSLPYLADELIHLYEDGTVETMMLVGGIGHATPFLQKNFKDLGVQVSGSSETEFYLDYFKQRYHLDKESFLIETRSTNSGENARFSLNSISEAKLNPTRVLLLQDPILQKRIKATFEKEWRAINPVFTNHVPIIPYVKAVENSIIFENEELNGLWSKEYFLSLVLGEIPRLKNDEKGYGPNGLNYIEAIDIPKTVYQSYEKLCQAYDYDTNR
ncbi:hypothetical protein I580_02087 [Enterococcus caccae ATCC BAA-1240]|uniref:DUF218 domain-containing protein n=2 Tax=Enterococcus caccae TaxID=317735 RepID=R3TWN7_9ENTE|nr:hypothetical protein UC7_01786 [Enterococcus caccae ATCC BAA-1240]EOT61185.1 hypothetical protein I580_02087 [Enterococcus caccae ATCC BAA-1240]